MHFTKTFSLFILALAFMSCGTTEKKIDTTSNDTSAVKNTNEVISYKVNTADSKVSWMGSILSVKSHEGTLNFESGKFSVKGGQLVEGIFNVDMSSMAATDENYQPEEGKTKEKLIGHLSSPDFFDVANNPKAILAVVDGKATMTVRGHAKGVELTNVKIAPNGDNLTASAEFTFDRQDFGVAFDMGMKDMAVSDDIKIKVDISASKN